MPTELEELVEFLHHGNAQIRQRAIEHLQGYSKSRPSLFKSRHLTPISDLKLLIKDYLPISKIALVILINLSYDAEILKSLATDDAFLDLLLRRISTVKEPNADEMAMLLANLSKTDEMIRILNFQREPIKLLSSSKLAIDQLMDCFVKGVDGKYNKNANFDYLSYVFADLAKDSKFRVYLTTPQPYDENIVPLTKLVVFTEHKSEIRRRGVASTIKNVAFDVGSHKWLMATSGVDAVNLLPYILLPLMGAEDYSEEDAEGMLEDLQLLALDKEREKDAEIVRTHIETLLLLTTTREGRETMRRIKVYPIIREVHLHVDNEEVREVCDRLVQVIMRDEEGEGEGEEAGKGDKVNGNARNQEMSDDDDEQITEIF